MHKYRLIAKKGEGTFSEVLKAQSIVNGKSLAIKCMRNQFHTIDQVNNLREIQALRRLSPHPNIVKLYEVLYDEPTGRLALVFELMDCNIYELIKGRRHYLPEQTVKVYMYQLLKAMDHMHRNGIFHRDIKPENILVVDNLLKLADFGSCRGIYSQQPYTEYISTRWYRAPECLLTDGYYGFKMDMWGIGCVLFEILALFPLFPGKDEADQIDRIHKIIGTPPRAVLEKLKKYSTHIDFSFPDQKGTGIPRMLGHVSKEAVDLIVKMLAYDPDDRISARQALRHPWFSDLRAAERKARENKAAAATEDSEKPVTTITHTGDPASALAEASEKEKEEMERKRAKAEKKAKAATAGTTSASPSPSPSPSMSGATPGALKAPSRAASLASAATDAGPHGTSSPSPLPASKPHKPLRSMDSKASVSSGADAGAGGLLPQLPAAAKPAPIVATKSSTSSRHVSATVSASSPSAPSADTVGADGTTGAPGHLPSSVSPLRAPQPNAGDAESSAVPQLPSLGSSKKDVTASPHQAGGSVAVSSLGPAPTPTPAPVQLSSHASAASSSRASALPRSTSPIQLRTTGGSTTGKGHGGTAAGAAAGASSSSHADADAAAGEHRDRHHDHHHHQRHSKKRDKERTKDFEKSKGSRHGTTQGDSGDGHGESVKSQDKDAHRRGPRDGRRSKRRTHQVTVATLAAASPAPSVAPSSSALPSSSVAPSASTSHPVVADLLAAGRRQHGIHGVGPDASPAQPPRHRRTHREDDSRAHPHRSGLPSLSGEPTPSSVPSHTYSSRHPQPRHHHRGARSPRMGGSIPPPSYAGSDNLPPLLCTVPAGEPLHISGTGTSSRQPNRFYDGTGRHKPRYSRNHAVAGSSSRTRGPGGAGAGPVAPTGTGRSSRRAPHYGNRTLPSAVMGAAAGVSVGMSPSRMGSVAESRGTFGSGRGSSSYMSPYSQRALQRNRFK